MDDSNYSAVVLAAGSGQRFASKVPKQWIMLGQQPVVMRSIMLFEADPRCQQIALVISADDVNRAQSLTSQKTSIVIGGDSREASTSNGLQALDPGTKFVLIHDAARPCVPMDVVDRVLGSLAQGANAVVPVLPVSDTLKHVETAKTIDRTSLAHAQTPQGFPYGLIKAAHEQGTRGTDDASLLEQLGHKTTFVAGDPRAHKLTLPGDRPILEAFMTPRSTRTGLGFDVHAFMTDGNAPHDNGDIAHRKDLILAGIVIPSTETGVRPLVGHSDADVVLHSITDAILGALADGDIGQHFPPNDPQWRGVSSDHFLTFAAVDRVALQQAEITNIDVTVICELPKIGPYRQAMQDRIAQICQINPSQVSVKATTTERLGFTGRGQGIACQAVATLEVAKHAEP